MRKLGMKIAVAAAVFCMAMPFASFAGTWKSDANGMWYQFDDGSYPKGRWAWIDTDNDGMAESFYFDENGYVLRNTTTPDGYQVNRIGAWVVGGEVKQKAGGETKNVRIFAYDDFAFEPRYRFFAFEVQPANYVVAAQDCLEHSRRRAEPSGFEFFECP